MIQIYFISPTGAQAVQQALKGIPNQRTHGWRAEGEDKQVIGVVIVDGHNMDLIVHEVCDAFDAAGIHILPDHKTNEAIAPEHHEKLKQHGVLPTDTTKQAMTKVHAIAGFPPLKPARF
jgi:hypothetical protein